jgi:hypothetical protein
MHGSGYVVKCRQGEGAAFRDAIPDEEEKAYTRQMQPSWTGPVRVISKLPSGPSGDIAVMSRPTILLSDATLS